MSYRKGTLEAILKGSKKAILIGMGGGGDIVGTIPTASLLRLFGVECVLGGLPWERFVIDPVPGPRTFDETVGAVKLNERVWYATSETATSTGVRFAESIVAEIYGAPTLLVDIHGGARGVRDGLLDAASKLGADLIVGIDVGGDAIAFGDEPGLTSPLADSITTSALAMLEAHIPTVMGVFGFGSDGELTQGELERSLAAIACEGGLLGSWGITHEALRELDEVCSRVPTEASRLPVDYLRGRVGEVGFIRSGKRSVKLSVASTVTFYISPGVVARKISKPARAVADCSTLEEANEALHAIGLCTELDLERERQRGAG